MEKINLVEKFGLFSEHWTPKLIGEVNDFQVKIAKLQGEFIWHKHDNEDELFMVIKGQLTIKLRNEDIVLNEGEIFIVPKGVEHKPIANEEAQVLLFEPRGTVNTGQVHNERTVQNLDRI